jgi:molybdopterin-binding protein/molybdate transport repressor ModE-like protein
MMNRFQAVVESFDPGESYAVLKLGRARIASRLWEGIRVGDTTTVTIPPQDVVLCSDAPGRVSARNVLPGRVEQTKITPQGAVVTLNVGFALSALVTRRAVRELRLTRGTPVFALVKAMAVVPEAATEIRFRVSAVGKNGEVSADHLDLLRAIESAGSISSAAKECGVTYRTAWQWVQSMNRAWGAPLVAKSRRGATLTAQACALLQEISRREK